MWEQELSCDDTSPFVFASPGPRFALWAAPGDAAGDEVLVKAMQSRMTENLQPAQGPQISQLQTRIQLFQLLHHLPTYASHWSDLQFCMLAVCFDVYRCFLADTTPA